MLLSMSEREDTDLEDFHEKGDSLADGTESRTRQWLSKVRSLVGGLGFERTGGEMIMNLFHSSKLYKKATGMALKGWFELSVVAVLPSPPLIMVGLVNPNYYFKIAPSRYSVPVIGAGITIVLFARFWCFLEDGMEEDTSR